VDSAFVEHFDCSTEVQDETSSTSLDSQIMGASAVSANCAVRF
jgi:hypothetical protein